MSYSGRCLKQLVLVCLYLYQFFMMVYAVSTSMEDTQATTIQTLKNITDIETINLENKNISKVERDSFADKKLLRHLHLGQNPLFIPHNESWFSHPTLTYLDISDCHLGAVDPTAFKDMPKLKVVTMTGNPGCLQSHKVACETEAHYTVKCGSEYKLECARSSVSVASIASLISLISLIGVSILVIFTMLIADLK